MFAEICPKTAFVTQKQFFWGYLKTIFKICDFSHIFHLHIRNFQLIFAQCGGWGGGRTVQRKVVNVVVLWFEWMGFRVALAAI